MDNANTVETNEVKGNDNKINNYTSIIEDHQGGLSSVRLLMLAWGLGTLLIWGVVALVSVCHGVYTLPALPESIVTVLIGITGIKTYQRQFGEKGN